MADNNPTARRLLITGLHHDLLLESSTVELTWADSVHSKLWLPVPFGCPIRDLTKEAGKAIDQMPTGRVGLVSVSCCPNVANDDRRPDA